MVRKTNKWLVVKCLFIQQNYSPGLSPGLFQIFDKMETNILVELSKLAVAFLGGGGLERTERLWTFTKY